MIRHSHTHTHTHTHVQIHVNIDCVKTHLMADQWKVGSKEFVTIGP